MRTCERCLWGTPGRAQGTRGHRTAPETPQQYLHCTTAVQQRGGASEPRAHRAPRCDPSQARRPAAVTSSPKPVCSGNRERVFHSRVRIFTPDGEFCAQLIPNSLLLNAGWVDPYLTDGAGQERQAGIHSCCWQPSPRNNL